MGTLTPDVRPLLSRSPRVDLEQVLGSGFLEDQSDLPEKEVEHPNIEKARIDN